MSKRIRVLIVDDSALVRESLREVIESDPSLEVIGAVEDPYAAVQKMKNHAPDVLVLDIEMPRMDGLTFLRKIMKQHPIPTVICSSLVQEGSAIALRALEYGAVEIIAKPNIAIRKFFEESKVRICDAIHAARIARLKEIIPAPRLSIPDKLTADVMLPKSTPRPTTFSTDIIVAMGASTGGTEALRDILVKMPENCPGIVIVQHMPEFFTEQFSKHLNALCAIEVLEAFNGCPVQEGRAVIAQGNKHLLIVRKAAKYHVEVRDGPLVCRHRPSVDVLFRSVAHHAGKNALGVILTGMGDDGAQGLLEMKQSGSFTIAQDEESCVVFGMPKEAIELKAVDKVFPLHTIPLAILKHSEQYGSKTIQIKQGARNG